MDKPHPLSPRLDHCPEGLPRAAYVAPDWFAAEMATVFARQWVCVGRVADFAPGTMRRVTVGAAPVIVCREHLAHLKCPRSVDFIDQMPRLPTGKLYKKPLREKYWAGHRSRIL